MRGAADGGVLEGAQTTTTSPARSRTTDAVFTEGGEVAFDMPDFSSVDDKA